MTKRRIFWLVLGVASVMLVGALKASQVLVRQPDCWIGHMVLWQQVVVEDSLYTQFLGFIEKDAVQVDPIPEAPDMLICTRAPQKRDDGQ